MPKVRSTVPNEERAGQQTTHEGLPSSTTPQTASDGTKGLDESKRVQHALIHFPLLKYTTRRYAIRCGPCYPLPSNIKAYRTSLHELLSALFPAGPQSKPLISPNPKAGDLASYP